MVTFLWASKEKSPGSRAERLAGGPGGRSPLGMILEEKSRNAKFAACSAGYRALCASNLALQVKEAIVAEDIEQKVKDIIVEQLGVDAGAVKSEASFVNDLGADSLDTVELVMALEEAFDIEIPDEEAEKIQTVGQAVDYINGHAKK